MHESRLDSASGSVFYNVIEGNALYMCQGKPWRIRAGGVPVIVYTLILAMKTESRNHEFLSQRTSVIRRITTGSE